MQKLYNSNVQIFEIVLDKKKTKRALNLAQPAQIFGRLAPARVTSRD